MTHRLAVRVPTYRLCSVMLADSRFLGQLALSAKATPLLCAADSASLVVPSRRFNGAPPVAAKTCFKPTFMVSEQTRPQTRFKPASKPVLMWIWPNDMNVDKWNGRFVNNYVANANINVDKLKICEHSCRFSKTT